MRRADRLFQIVQLLRARRVTTAARLARELEVSERTIYRDIQDLIGSGVPITGEAGVGYALPRGFDLPPLMFTRREVEALVLGARVVEAWGDDALARDAKNAVRRIEAALPDALKGAPAATLLFAPEFHIKSEHKAHLAAMRQGIEERRKVRLGYRRPDGEASERLVRPLGLYFWGHAWSIVGYCELREGFRNFRLDRVASLELTDERFEDEPGKSLDDAMRAYDEELTRS